MTDLNGLPHINAPLPQQECVQPCRAEEVFRGLLNVAPDAMIVVNEKGEITLANAMAEEMLGYSSEELVGEAMEIVVPERFRNRHREYRSKYGEKPHVRPMASGLNLAARRKDGTEFPVEISLSPMRASGGTLIFCSVRDITERRNAEKQIETSLRIQQAISSLLQISLESISLEEMFKRTLNLLFAIPWLSLEAKGAVFLQEEGTLSLSMKTQIGLPDELLHSCAEVPFGHCLCGAAAESRQIVYSNCVDKRHETQFPGMAPHGHYCIPILSGQRLYGVINLYLKHGHVRRPEDEEFLSSVADILAGTIKRVRTEETLLEHEAQLLAAEEIQQRLLPAEAPALPGFDIAGAVYPAEHAAGDLYDYLPMEDGCLGIMVGDVSGHGFSSALVTASTHAYLHSLSELGIGIDETMARVNSALIRDTKEDLFITAVFARLDPQTRTVTYINAGHPNGYVLDPSGDEKAHLPSGTIPLAILPDVEFPIGGPISLEPGDLLFLLTDGVLEARASEGPMFGTERALKVVRDNRGKAAREIIEILYQAALEYSGREKLDDDVTVVVIKVLE
ncbi:MAG: SpoIIE family protein phosphatase [Pirellulaceae bacterium]|nr:SpoIIE family protein phosphatase [Pirellulaceae bacterium]